MFGNTRFSTWLGLFFVAFALLVLFVWIPLDVETSYFETRRRKLIVGDALAPTVAGVVILLGAVMTMFRPGAEAGLNRANLWFVCKFLVVLAVSFSIMRWLGPALGAVLTEAGYRPLRDTMPWKITGYLAGGTLMIAALIALAEHRLRWQAVAIGLAACLALVAIYDLPFDDLLLPPNGDV